MALSVYMYTGQRHQRIQFSTERTLCTKPILTCSTFISVYGETLTSQFLFYFKICVFVYCFVILYQLVKMTALKGQNNSRFNIKLHYKNSLCRLYKLLHLHFSITCDWDAPIKIWQRQIIMDVLNLCGIFNDAVSISIYIGQTGSLLEQN